MRRWAGALAVLVAAVLLADRMFPPELARVQQFSLVVAARDGAVLDVLAAPDGYIRLPAAPADVDLPAAPADADPPAAPADVDPPAAPAGVDPKFISLLLATEDKRFWLCPGIDPLAMARAVGQLVTHGHVVSGGSTITMQLARLLHPHRHDMAGKLLDMARALQLQAHFSKARILAMYLTLAPYGGNIEGVRAASLIYFGKPPLHLTTAEAALLVALPRRPEALRPDRHAPAALAATRLVLARAGLSAAFPATDLPLRPRRGLARVAPHLAQRLRGLGLCGVVATTLDGTLQTELAALAAREQPWLGPRANMAALVVENRSRNILAYLGGADFFAPQGMVDMVRAVRSPGSTLKPFIYGMAIDAALITPASLIEDAPMAAGGYAPRDFDGAFHGQVTAGEALRQSYNLPAVLLLRAIGPARFYGALQAAGAGMVLPGAAPGLPIALGGVGISLERLAMLYAGLAEGGQAGRLRFLPGQAGVRAPLMTTAAAAEIAGILRGAPLPDGVAAGRAIAFKTGTSYGLRDAWAAGFSPDYTVVVWTGRTDGTPSPGAYGRRTAAPLLFKIFALLPPDGAAPPPVPAAPAMGLQLFGQPAFARPGPRILFPPPGATLQVTQAGGATVPLSLEAAGGAAPYRWVVNGEILPEPPVGMAMTWQPPGPGFAHIAVIDKNDEAASEDISMR